MPSFWQTAISDRDKELDSCERLPIESITDALWCHRLLGQKIAAPTRNGATVTNLVSSRLQSLGVCAASSRVNSVMPSDSTSNRPWLPEQRALPSARKRARP